MHHVVYGGDGRMTVLLSITHHPHVEKRKNEVKVNMPVGRWIPCTLTSVAGHILHVLCYLSTSGSAINDEQWCRVVDDILDYICQEYRHGDFVGWLWTGDFNFQPTEITGQKDSSKARRAR